MKYNILKDLNKVIFHFEKSGNRREAFNLHNLFVKIADTGRFCDSCGKEVGKYSSMCGACGAAIKEEPNLNYSVLDSWDEKGEAVWRPGNEKEKSDYKDFNSGHSVLDGWDEEGESVWRPATKEERRQYNEFDKGNLFCQQCGNKMSPYSSMCSKCGTKK